MKKYLMVTYYILNKVLDKFKDVISTENFNGTKGLINADDKFPGDTPLKIVVILMTNHIKDDDKLYPLIFLEEVLYVKIKSFFIDEK